ALDASQTRRAPPRRPVEIARAMHGQIHEDRERRAPMPEYEEIIYDVDGPVLTITLNRPDKLNAFTFTMMNEVIDAFDHADTDDDIRAVIVTGAGRGFCAGADLTSGEGTFDYRDTSGNEAR